MFHTQLSNFGCLLFRLSHHCNNIVQSHNGLNREHTVQKVQKSSKKFKKIPKYTKISILKAVFGLFDSDSTHCAKATTTTLFINI
jgi:hypothetical protein